MSEPMSEDDYPDDRIVSFKPIGQGKDKRSFNYIKEEGKYFFKPFNIQIESSNDDIDEQ